MNVDNHLSTWIELVEFQDETDVFILLYLAVDEALNLAIEWPLEFLEMHLEIIPVMNFPACTIFNNLVIS